MEALVFESIVAEAKLYGNNSEKWPQTTNYTYCFVESQKKSSEKKFKPINQIK